MSGDAAPGLRESFDRLVDLSPEARQLALAELARNHPELAEHLRRMLPAEEAGPTVDDPIAERLLRSIEGAPPAHGQLGPYRLLRLIGSGGMGWVYLAERDADGVRQQVALKLVRGAAEAALNDPFQRERSVLASLEHPNIARFLDAGSVDGQRYLVMEYVQGQSLAEWLAQRRPRLEQRLDLLIALAEAVDHAHAKLVVHRDLKPANLLVRSDGTPVLLDFGIAKLLDGEDPDRLTSTRVYTPTYAAPEQIAGQPVTVATDVFGLGLLLFELLCGEPARGGDGAVRTRPGQIARSSGQAWVKVEASGIDVELDRIVAMALREEPERRYRSAADLIADLRRWQNGLPVRAMPDSFGYRSRKWLLRHRWGAAVATLAVVFTAVFIVQLDAALQRALSAEQQAQQKARTAQAVADLMTDLFNGADPRIARNADLSARALLERGADRLSSQATGDPAIDAQLHLTVGTLLAGIGDPAAAVAQFDAGLALAPLPPLQRADLLHERARALSRQLMQADAERSAREALALRESQLGPTAVAVGHALQSLGVPVQQQGRGDEAEALFLRAEAIFAGQDPPDLEGLASSRHNMGWVAQARGDTDLAIRRYGQAVDDKTRLYGAEDPRTVFSMLALGQSLGQGGQVAQAIEWMEKAVEGRRKTNGPDSAETAFALNELGLLRQEAGDLAQALADLQEALDISLRVDPDSTDVARFLNNLGGMYELRGDLAAAVDHLQASLKLRVQLFGAQHLNTVRVEHNLCRIRLEQGPRSAAQACSVDVFERRRAALGEAHPEVEDSRALMESLQPTPDRAWLRERYDFYRQKGGAQLARSMRFAWLLAMGAADSQDLDRLTRLAEDLRAHYGERSIRAALTELKAAELALHLGRSDELGRALSQAEPVLADSLAPQAAQRARMVALRAAYQRPGATAR